jgi:hypothetical protein
MEAQVRSASCLILALAITACGGDKDSTDSGSPDTGNTDTSNSDTGNGDTEPALSPEMGAYTMEFLELLSDECGLDDELSGASKDLQLSETESGIQIALELGEAILLDCSTPDPAMSCTGAVSEDYSLGTLSVTITQTLSINALWESDNAFAGQLDIQLACVGDCGVAEAYFETSFPCSASATIQSIKN